MGRHKLYTKVEDMEKIINEYFKKCDKTHKPYTVSGLALALDMDRKSILNYAKDEKFFHTIKRAKEKIEQQLEENALMNKGNATFTIFNLKNNFGWKDSVEVQNEGLDKVGELLSKIEEGASND